MFVFVAEGFSARKFHYSGFENVNDTFLMGQHQTEPLRCHVAITDENLRSSSKSRWLSTIYHPTICSSRVKTCLRHPSFLSSDIHGETSNAKAFFPIRLNEFHQIWSIRLQLKQISNASPEESGIKIIKCITRWDMENNFSICKCHK